MGLIAKMQYLAYLFKNLKKPPWIFQAFRWKMQIGENKSGKFRWGRSKCSPWWRLCINLENGLKLQFSFTLLECVWKLLSSSEKSTGPYMEPGWLAFLMNIDSFRKLFWDSVKSFQWISTVSVDKHRKVLWFVVFILK